MKGMVVGDGRWEVVYYLAGFYGGGCRERGLDSVRAKPDYWRIAFHRSADTIVVCKSCANPWRCFF